MKLRYMGNIRNINKICFPQRFWNTTVFEQKIGGYETESQHAVWLLITVTHHLSLEFVYWKSRPSMVLDTLQT